MTTAAFSGVGTTLTINGNTISEINSITGPNPTRDFIDVTSLDSSGGYREFITGFRDAGELTMNCNFSVAAWDDWYNAFEISSTTTCVITLPNTAASQFEFSGYCTSISLGIPLDDKVTMDITFKLTGPITFTS